MTVVHMSDKGQIAVPKEIRDRRGFRKGSVFSVLETQSGALMLRPINPRPKLSLVEHLKRLRGLEVPEMRFHCPPRV